MTMRERLAGVVLISSVVIACLVLAGAGGPVRVALTFWFLLACPGMVIAATMPIVGRVEAALVVVATSLMIDTLVATCLLIAGRLTPGFALTILIALCGTGSAVLLVRSRRGRRNTFLRPYPIPSSFATPRAFSESAVVDSPSPSSNNGLARADSA